MDMILLPANATAWNSCMPESWLLATLGFHTACAQGGQISKQQSLPYRWGHITQTSRELHNIIISLLPSCQNMVTRHPRVDGLAFLKLWPPFCIMLSWTSSLGLTLTYGRCCTFFSKLSVIVKSGGMPQEKTVSLLCERTQSSWSKTTCPLGKSVTEKNFYT